MKYIGLFDEKEDIVTKEKLETKQDKITGAATTITDDNLTASHALVSDANGKVAVSAVTSTELGYLDGVTSNVQTQLNKKLESVPVTSVNGKTGAVTLGKSDVGLGSVDNVRQYSDTNPPPYPVTSVNGKTGAVSVNVPTVPSTTSLIKGDGSGGLMVAVAETDFASPVSMRKVTLTTAGWGSSTKQQTVAVPGMLADGTKQKVICSPIDESYDSAWNSCYVQCVGHGADSLTFQCDEIPTAAIEVFVSIQPVNFAS